MSLGRGRSVNRRDFLARALALAGVGVAAVAEGTAVAALGSPGPNSPNFLSNYDARYVKKAGDTMTGPLKLRFDVSNGLFVKDSLGNDRQAAVVFNDGIQDVMQLGSQTPGAGVDFGWQIKPVDILMSAGMPLDAFTLGRPPNIGAQGSLGYAFTRDRVQFTDGTDQVQDLSFTKDFSLTKYYGSVAKAGVMQTYGMNAPLQILEGVGASAMETVDADSTFITYTTGGAAGSRAGLQSGTFTLFRRGHLVETAVAFKLNTLTNIRLWLLVTDSNIGASDNPAGNYYGLRYSSTTDTTIKMVTKDGTTQNVFDTGYFPVVGQYYALISRWQDSNTVQLLLINPAVSATFAGRTFITNLVSSTANLGFQATLESKVGGAKSWLVSRWGAFQREHV